jgi:hypothetical protein
VNTATGIPLLCTDAWAPAKVGDSFSAYVGNLSTPDLTHARFSGIIDGYSQLQHYQMAAWLFGQMPLNPGTTDTVAIMYAVWNLFRGYGVPTELESRVEDYLEAAQAAVPTFGTLNWGSVYLYTPDTSGYQEFLRGTPNPVPIPAAAWLLGSGLLGLVAIRRRMKK